MGVTKTDLFTASQGGYAGYRIPALIVPPQNTVLAVCEARRPTLRDWGHIDLVLRRSPDGGRTWEPARVLVGQGDLPADVAHNPAAVERKLTVLLEFCRRVVAHAERISAPADGD